MQAQAPAAVSFEMAQHVQHAIACHAARMQTFCDVSIVSDIWEVQHAAMCAAEETAIAKLSFAEQHWFYREFLPLMSTLHTVFRKTVRGW